jgi:putative acetyltransferase
MDPGSTLHDIDLRVATTASDFGHARVLFEEYAAQLGVDLCFQNFSVELATLPAMYGPPVGRLILAQEAGELLGCVGVRRLSSAADGTGELKRLYVRAAARGRGLGRRLAEASIAAARELGYARVVLDTLGTMTAARTLYADLGFRGTPAFYANPNDDVAFLELRL